MANNLPFNDVCISTEVFGSTGFSGIRDDILAIPKLKFYIKKVQSTVDIG